MLHETLYISALGLSHPQIIQNSTLKFISIVEKS